MAKLIVLVGPPGSGKSTLATQLMNFHRINQDDQGKMYKYYYEQAVKDKLDIVVDRMNFNKEQRNYFLNIAKSAGYETEIQVLHQTMAECYTRCKERKNHPTVKTEVDIAKALHFFFTKYERVEDSEADTIRRIYPYITKPEAVVCDLDGTLCNIDHRLHWVRNMPKNWTMFFQGINNDKVNDWCRRIMELIRGPSPLDATATRIYCSGRGEEYQDTTEKWLKQNLIQYDHLFMRKKGDYRPDHIVKEIILDFEILTRYTPLFFIDDRKQVVDMWRRRGFICLQCAPGDF